MGKCEPATAGCSHEELSVEPVVRLSITGSWYRLSPVTMLPRCPRKPPGDGGERGKALPWRRRREELFSTIAALFRSLSLSLALAGWFCGDGLLEISVFCSPSLSCDEADKPLKIPVEFGPQFRVFLAFVAPERKEDTYSGAGKLPGGWVGGWVSA